MMTMMEKSIFSGMVLCFQHESHPLTHPLTALDDEDDDASPLSVTVLLSAIFSV
jgi:hypothetical protein